ncbi:MAG: BamA/TamA family outer membrane protein [Pseudomonadota bacterium]
MRVTAGFGLSYASPVGPLQLDFAFPLVKEDFDRTESFRFSIGATF